MAKDEDANDEQHTKLWQVQGVQKEGSKATTVQHYGIRTDGLGARRPVGIGDYDEHQDTPHSSKDSRRD